MHNLHNECSTFVTINDVFISSKSHLDRSSFHGYYVGMDGWKIYTQRRNNKRRSEQTLHRNQWSQRGPRGARDGRSPLQNAAKPHVLHLTSKNRVRGSNRKLKKKSWFLRFQASWVVYRKWVRHSASNGIVGVEIGEIWKKWKKWRESKKLVVILFSGHSWMPLGSIPGHPDASRSIPILVSGE